MLGRTLLRLVLIGGVVLVVVEPLRGAIGGEASQPTQRVPAAPTRGLPPELAEIVRHAAAIQRGSLAGRLVGGRSRRDVVPDAPGEVMEPFANRGSKRRIARLRRDVRQALRNDSTPDDRLSVGAWHGVYVSGHRAIALIDLRRRTRLRRGLPFRTAPLQRTRIAMIRERGRWRIVSSR